MIHEEICTYEVAKLAKKKGFPIEELKTWHYDYDGYSARRVINEHSYPHLTQSLLQRWLREEKYLFVDIGMAFNGYYYQITRTDNFDGCLGTQISEHFNGNKFDTYELALEDALAYSLKNLV